MHIRLIAFLSKKQDHKWYYKLTVKYDLTYFFS